MNVQPVNAVGAEQLRSMIEEHVEATDSKRGRKILANWDAYLPKFKQVTDSARACRYYSDNSEGKYRYVQQFEHISCICGCYILIVSLH